MRTLYARFRAGANPAAHRNRNADAQGVIPADAPMVLERIKGRQAYRMADMTPREPLA